MTATDLWGGTRNTAELEPKFGPSDREVVSHLQRVASAQSHLTLAEQTANDDPDKRSSRLMDERDRAIEHAHAEVIWAQASLISDGQRSRAQKALRLAEVREANVLKRYGCRSFRAHLAGRDTPTSADIHLELARREHTAALEAWETLQADFAPTMILDLTGEEPHVIS